MATRVIKLLVTRRKKQPRRTAAILLPQLISGFEANPPDWQTREILVHFAGTIAWELSNFAKSHVESLNTILSRLLKALVEDPEVFTTNDAYY